MVTERTRHFAELVERELREAEQLDQEIQTLEELIKLKMTEAKARREAAALLERMLATSDTAPSPPTSAKAESPKPTAPTEDTAPAVSVSVSAPSAPQSAAETPPAATATATEPETAPTPVTDEPVKRKRGRPPKERPPLFSAPSEVVAAVDAVTFHSTPPGITEDMPALYSLMIHETIKAHYLGMERVSSTFLAEKISQKGTFGNISGRKFTPHAGRIPYLQFEKIDGQGHWQYTHNGYLHECFKALDEIVGQNRSW